MPCVSLMATTPTTIQAPIPAPLPTPTYRMCFPILATLLAADKHTPYLDDTLAVAALHVATDQPDLPRPEALQALYHILGVLPSYQDRVLPIMEALCRGCAAEQLSGAVVGVLAPQGHVRSAALTALSNVPVLAEGLCPEDDAVVSALWVAKHDVEGEIAGAC